MLARSFKLVVAILLFAVAFVALVVWWVLKDYPEDSWDYSGH